MSDILFGKIAVTKLRTGVVVERRHCPKEKKEKNLLQMFEKILIGYHTKGTDSSPWKIRDSYLHQ